MASIRDVNCGNDVGKMDRLGKFDRDFIVYGCGFLENNQIKYMLSSNENTIIRFVEDSYFQDIVTTPVCSKWITCPVLSGTREDIIQNTKIALAKEIKRDYSGDYYQFLEQIARQNNNNFFYDALKNEQEKLIGLFQSDSLNWFEGLVKLAFVNKGIDKNSYQQFMQWIRKNRKQMEDDCVIKKVFQRQFSGFAYRNDGGEVAYYYDALFSIAYNKKESLEQSGKLVSPIFIKEYWFDQDTSLKELKKIYLNDLKKNIDEPALNLVEQIKKRFMQVFNEYKFDNAYQHLTLQEQIAVSRYFKIP